MTLQELLDLAESIHPIEPDSAEAKSLASGHQALLKSLDIIVEGELEGTSTIIAFSMQHMKSIRINRIDLVKMENLVQWFGEEIEDQVWSGFGEKPPGPEYTLQQVKRAIAAEGGKKQIRENDRRGAGVWESSDRLLLVGEHELAVINGSMEKLKAPKHEGTSVQFGTCEQWYDFDKLQSYITQASNLEWRAEVTQELTELFERWDNWSKPYDAKLVASLVMCTWVQTVWKWRPLVFVTGPTNSGKSMLLEETLPHLFGPISLFMQKASEAGLRQSIQQTAKIAILDEFESGRDRQAILELARTAGRGGQIVKGTASQKATVFGLKHILWCGAIETGLHAAADRNRFITLELNRVVKKKDDKMLSIPSREYLADLGMKSLAVAAQSWKQVQALAVSMQNAGIEGIDHRLIESYSLPAAMLKHNMGYTDQTGIAYLEEIMKARELDTGLESDEPDLLVDIFSSVIRVKNEDRSISELLFKTNYDIGSEEALERSGIKKLAAYGDDPERIFFVPRVVMKNLLERSPSYRGKKISEMLKRIPGAKNQKNNIGGQRPRGIAIPLVEINRLINGDDDESEGPESSSAQQADQVPSVAPGDVFDDPDIF